MQAAITGMRDVALKAIESKNSSEERQVELMKIYANELSAISTVRTRELSAKLRPSLIDMARPTSNDAAYMTLSVSDKNTPLVYMDERTVESLKGNSLDNTPELTSARFIQYNVETGWGKVRLAWRISPYRFSVHSMLREDVNLGILSAMNTGRAVWVWFYCLRDKAGNIMSLVFDSFAKDTEIPPP
jgi:hypothetical protein